MFKNFNQLFYPNPFRDRKFKNIVSQYETLEEVRETLDPILRTRYNELPTYINEFAELRSELRIIRATRFAIEQKVDELLNRIDLIFKKRRLLRLAKFITRPIRKRGIIEFEKQMTDLTFVQNYERNLRYLDLRVHPFTDKFGFEIPLLSNEVMDEAITDMLTGYTSIYDFCTHRFPDTIELWDDLAWYMPGIYPVINIEYRFHIRNIFVDRLMEMLSYDKYFGFRKWLFTANTGCHPNRSILRVVPTSLHPNVKELLYTVLRHVGVVIVVGGFIRACLKKYDSVRYIDLTKEDIEKDTLDFKIAELKMFSLSETLLEIESELIGLTEWLQYTIERTSLRIKKANLPMRIKYKTLKLLIGRS